MASAAMYIRSCIFSRRSASSAARPAALKSARIFCSRSVSPGEAMAVATTSFTYASTSLRPIAAATHSASRRFRRALNLQRPLKVENVFVFKRPSPIVQGCHAKAPFPYRGAKGREHRVRPGRNRTLLARHDVTSVFRRRCAREARRVDSDQSRPSENAVRGLAVPKWVQDFELIPHFARH